jgi:ADP-heptose:LPS heptosyltransferase
VDTMTAIAQLDLVISVDTMVAHLAGAMGKPVWVLLGYAADWRWMLDRSDTPWYRSMRLFRQSATADWKIVIGDLIDALQILYRARTSPFLETLRC